VSGEKKPVRLSEVQQKGEIACQKCGCKDLLSGDGPGWRICRCCGERTYMGQPRQGEVYSFPTRVRCPKCGSLRTRSNGTVGNVQYRVCLESECGERWKVGGERV
jgi:hypothetical protein